MAYQTGSSSGHADLIAKLRIFAAANGWTVDAGAAGNPWTHLHNAAGQHVDLYNDTNYIYLRPSTGYSASGWGNQPGSTTAYTFTNTGSGAFANYWFFGDQNQISVVIERTAGVFNHFSFGMAEKHGTYNGGEWVSSSRFDSNGSGGAEDYNNGMFCGRAYYPSAPNTIIRCSGVDGIANWWVNVRQDRSHPGNQYGGTSETGMVQWSGRLGMEDAYIHRSPSVYNHLTYLSPIRGQIRRAAGLASPIASIKKIRYVNMTELQTGDEINFGSEVWKVFPLSWRGTINTNTASGETGLAYLKEV